MNYIKFFTINIPTYSIMIIIGLIIANLLALKILKKYKINTDNFILLETYAFSFGMLGAKLLYLFIIRNYIQWNQITNWEYSKNFLQGGFVFYGGLFGGFMGIYIASIIHNIPIKMYIIKLIFALPLAHGFGRIGCYLSGCCYGIPYNGPFYVEYHNIPYSLCNVKLFPIQLVEALLLLSISSIYLYICYKKNPTSLLLPITYFLCYGIIRFILEFFRYDSQRGLFWFFSTSQWISIFVILTSSILLLYAKSTTKNSLN